MTQAEVAGGDSVSEPLTPHGGYLLARTLRGSGIDTIFAVCGEHIFPLLDGCIDAGIRVIDFRHEGGAALAAEGYALATGRPGFVAVTAGPGFGNAFTAFMDAGVWTVPLILFAGRTGLDRRGLGAVMDVDQARIAAPVAKWTATCYETQRIPQITAQAVWHARAGKPGAVYLEVPADVLHQAVPDTDGAADGYPDAVPRATGAPQDLQKALELLENAERPLVLAGGGAFWSGAGDRIARLCETAKIPVTTTSTARGLVPDSHPWCLGGLIHGGAALLGADVVLLLGSAFNANVMYGRSPLFNGDQKIIQVDLRPENIGGNRRPDVAVVGDVAQVAMDLTDAWRKTPEGREAWLEQARSATAVSRSLWDQQIDAYSGSKVHAGAMAKEVVAFCRDEIGDGVTLLADGGDANAWAFSYAYAGGPGRLLTTTTALGTLGVGVPFALAAKAARPDEPVILIAGDGAFGLSAMEIDTAVRHDLPVVAVVSNNAAWGDVIHGQDSHYGPGRRIGSELAPVRYDLLAEALGGHGEHVTSIEQLRPALQRALAADKPAVINVETDKEVLSELLRSVPQMGLM